MCAVRYSVETLSNVFVSTILCNTELRLVVRCGAGQIMAGRRRVASQVPDLCFNMRVGDRRVESVRAQH